MPESHKRRDARVEPPEALGPPKESNHSATSLLREFTLEETFGSVKPLQMSEDFEELSRLAKEEKVARSLAEMDEQS